MTDNQLFTLVRTLLLAQLPGRGLTGWKVARKFQTLQQGANSTPTVYVFKVGDKRHGSPEHRDEWNAATLTQDTVESQQMETTFQASVEMDEGTDPEALTPSDAANEVAAIMQSDEALAALQAQGVGIFRIGAVLNPYNVNDRNRFDANPSFDFVLTHRRERAATVPRAVSVEGSFNRV